MFKVDIGERKITLDGNVYRIFKGNFVYTNFPLTEGQIREFISNKITRKENVFFSYWGGFLSPIFHNLGCLILLVWLALGCQIKED